MYAKLLETQKQNELLRKKTHVIFQEAEKIIEDDKPSFQNNSLVSKENYAFSKDLSDFKNQNLLMISPENISPLPPRDNEQNSPQAQIEKISDQLLPASDSAGSTNSPLPFSKSETFSLKNKTTSQNSKHSSRTSVSSVGKKAKTKTKSMFVHGQDLGTEGNIRMLKAKINALQDELSRFTADSLHKQEQIGKLIIKNSNLEEENCVLNKSLGCLKQQNDKNKTQLEETQKRMEVAETQLLALQKEVSETKRYNRQNSAHHNATQAKLHRTAEDLDKNKTIINKLKSENKDLIDNHKKAIETLTHENKKLEKQKQELIEGFKKQIKLIDILKRQKMQLEAARMLQFSEDEFVKILDWYK